jgi:hypothetical protein
MNDPCKMCGSAVRIRNQSMPSLASRFDEQFPVRVCTNPRCDSNTGQMSFADVV